MYPIFPRRPRPSRAGSPGQEQPPPGNRAAAVLSSPTGLLAVFFSLFMGEAARDGRPELRLLRAALAPLLPIQLSLRPQAEQVKDQRHRQQEDGHPGHRSAGVHQGGPVLELHQMLVVEDLQKQGPGAGRHAEETGQPCPVPARLSPGEIHRWDAPGGQAQQQAPQVHPSVPHFIRPFCVLELLSFHRSPPKGRPFLRGPFFSAGSNSPIGPCAPPSGLCVGRGLPLE